MQLASSRVWTRVAVTISYDDNHYTTGTYWHVYDMYTYADLDLLKVYNQAFNAFKCNLHFYSNIHVT